jgi:hypothetical protein
MDTFYDEGYSQIEVRLYSDETLGEYAPGDLTVDDLGTPGYIVVERIGGPERYDVLMTEAISEETLPRTIVIGYWDIDRGMDGFSYALAGFVKDEAGNETDLAALQFTIVFRGRVPFIVINTGDHSAEIAAPAAGAISVVAASNIKVSLTVRNVVEVDARP